MIPWRYLAAAAGAVAVLVAAYAFGNSHGRAAVQSKWDAETIRLSEAALAAEKEQRAREQALQDARLKAEEENEQIKKRAADDSARAASELDRLRDELAARDRTARKDSAASGRTDAAAGTERELLGSCAAALVDMARDADKVRSKLLGLQGYVRGVCK